MKTLNAPALRNSQPKKEDVEKIKRNPIWIIVDNVLDTYNIGAIFRLADAVAAEEVMICGESETPPNSKIKRASIDTWKWVRWQYVPTASEAIAKFKMQNPKGKIIAVEQDKRSVPFQEATYEFPLAIVVGHESDGVSREMLEIADIIVEIPMHGVNQSLNVMVSLGIVLFEAVRHLPK